MHRAIAQTRVRVARNPAQSPALFCADSSTPAFPSMSVLHMPVGGGVCLQQMQAPTTSSVHRPKSSMVLRPEAQTPSCTHALNRSSGKEREPACRALLRFTSRVRVHIPPRKVTDTCECEHSTLNE